MWNTLLRKMLTSRKFIVMASGFLIKVLTPVAGRYGIDISFLNEALMEWMPIIIAWVLGQSAVDFANAKKAEILEPPPLPE